MKTTDCQPFVLFNCFRPFFVPDPLLERARENKAHGKVPFLKAGSEKASFCRGKCLLECVRRSSLSAFVS